MKPYLKITGLLAFMLLATGLTVNGQLIKAYLEKLSDDPAGAGEGRIYYNTTTKKAMLHNGTAFGPLGAGAGGGSVNYVPSPDSADTGWQVVGLPANGIIGTTTTDSSELPRVGYDTQAVKLSNQGSGEDGAGQCFQIGSADKNKILAFHAATRCGGGYASGDFTYRVAKHDSSDCSGSSTDVKFIGRDTNDPVGLKDSDGFYDEFLADGDYYQIIFERAAGSSGWCALSSITVGPDTRIMGAVVGEWEPFTPSFNNNTGHAATVVAYKRRVGDNLEINFTYTLGGDGDAGSTFTMNLPDSLNLAMTDVTLGTGYLTIEDGTTDYYSAVTAIYPSSGTSTIRFISENPSGLKQRVLEQEDFGTSSARIRFLAINMSIPILEWRGKGTTQMLTQGHLYANAKFRVVSDSTATVGNNTTVTSQWNTVQENNVNATFSSGAYTVKADGRYRVTAQMEGTGATEVLLYIRKNGANYATGLATAGKGIVTASVDAVAGDLITILRSGGGTLTLSGNTLTNYLEIERISDYTHGTGVGLGLATADDPGLLPRYQTTTFTLDGDFSSGTALLTRVGNVVTITGLDVWVHTTSASPITTSAIPAEYRPATVTGSAYVYGSNEFSAIEVLADGTIRLRHKNPDTGADDTRGTSNLAPTISYVVSD